MINFFAPSHSYCNRHVGFRLRAPTHSAGGQIVNLTSVLHRYTVVRALLTKIQTKHRLTRDTWTKLREFWKLGTDGLWYVQLCQMIWQLLYQQEVISKKRLFHSAPTVRLAQSQFYYTCTLVRCRLISWRHVWGVLWLGPKHEPLKLGVKQQQQLSHQVWGLPRPRSSTHRSTSISRRVEWQ